MSLSESNREVVVQFFDALNRLDLDTISDVYAEDAEFHLQGDHQYSGHYYGKTDVVATYHKSKGIWKGRLTRQVGEIVVQDATALVFLRMRAERDGSVSEWNRHAIITLRDGKFATHRVYEDDPDLVNVLYRS